MLIVRPSSDHPIYLEWKKWSDKCDASFGTPDYMVAIEAKHSIERIAEHIYPDGCIVGFMIMKKDTELMEARQV